MSGGNFTNAGAIHISEIPKTLLYIEKTLGIDSARQNVLGSVGKKEYSGDIDIAVDDVDVDLLKTHLDSILGNKNVKNLGAMFSLLVPIQGYSSKITTDLKRTGYVQVDLIFGDLAWNKVFYYSPGSDSKFKGAHRNTALSALSKHINRVTSNELDSFGRPVIEYRWKLSSKGLVKVKRESIRDPRTDKWLRKQNDTPLTDAIKDPEEIAIIMFKNQGSAKDLESLEKIVSAVKRGYSKEKQKEIFKDMAEYMKSISQGYEFPKEIAQYL